MRERERERERERRERERERDLTTLERLDVQKRKKSDDKLNKILKIHHTKRVGEKSLNLTLASC